jgi:hypothetical protein
MTPCGYAGGLLICGELMKLIEAGAMLNDDTQ